MIGRSMQTFGVAARRGHLAIARLAVALMATAAGAAEPPKSEKAGVAERAGKAIDETAERAGKALKETGEKIGKGAEAAGKKVGEVVTTAAEKTGQALQKAGKKSEETAGARRDGTPEKSTPRPGSAEPSR